MQSISRCETLVNYSGLYEEEKGIEKRAYNKGYGKNAVASYSVCTKSRLELCQLYNLVYGS